MDYGETNATAAWLAAVDYDDTVRMVSIYHQANRPTRSAAHNILYVLHR